MRHIPLADRVIVEELAERKKTKAGIWIPDKYTNQKSVAFGTVLEVGAGRVNAGGKVVPLAVKRGDVVMFPRQAPAAVPIFDDEGDEKIVLLLREADIVSIVEGMPRASLIYDVAGAPLSIDPQSLARADSTYKAEEEIRIAEREGWSDPDEHVDE